MCGFRRTLGSGPSRSPRGFGTAEKRCCERDHPLTLLRVFESTRPCPSGSDETARRLDERAAGSPIPSDGGPAEGAPVHRKGRSPPGVVASRVGRRAGGGRQAFSTEIADWVRGRSRFASASFWSCGACFSPSRSGSRARAKRELETHRRAANVRVNCPTPCGLHG
jgi:hypothetical protein